jgi:hypothetical protein
MRMFAMDCATTMDSTTSSSAVLSGVKAESGHEFVELLAGLAAEEGESFGG